jgi:hypothetical protein
MGLCMHTPPERSCAGATRLSCPRSQRMRRNPAMVVSTRTAERYLLKTVVSDGASRARKGTHDRKRLPTHQRTYISNDDAQQAPAHAQRHNDRGGHPVGVLDTHGHRQGDRGGWHVPVHLDGKVGQLRRTTAHGHD